jgi:arginine decarboxylase
VDIQAIKDAVRELSQIYVQLHGMGLTPTYLDVGGGLGVNYGGGYDENPEGAIQYSLNEYANAIVYTVLDACDDHDTPYPTLVSESGRALTAHHSVLIVDVLGAYRKDNGDLPPTPDDAPAPLWRLATTLSWLSELATAPPAPLRLLEAYHDARDAREQSSTRFDMGFLSLADKAGAERLYWAVCRGIWNLALKLPEKDVPNELYELDAELADHYLCNFSVFQSLLDHWAIGQQFPIVPLTRLDERPDRRAVVVDLTCDSDGKVSRYVCGESARYLPVHELQGEEPYRLGVFLVGAYQDIMGDTHNLLGRVPEAHIYADAEEPGGYFVEKIISGMTIKDMLALVQYFPNDLHRRMQEIIRKQQEAGGLKPRTGVELLNRYESLFNDNTYVERGRVAHARDSES